MKPAWLLMIGLTAALLATGGFAQQMDFNKVEIITNQMAPNLYMLSGSGGLDPSHDDAAGGRIGVLAGPDGILMVDSQYAQLTDKVAAAIRRISTAPIRYLVNTHIHRDHTAGNANFARMGAMILAREELREGMVRISKSPNASANPLSDPAGFPVVTYGMGTPLKIRMNGEVVDLIRSLERRRQQRPAGEVDRRDREQAQRHAAIGEAPRAMRGRDRHAAVSFDRAVG